MTTSPRLSFRGYSFGTALYKNKDSIKGIIALLGGVNIVVGFDWRVIGLSVLGGLAALAVKLVSDAVDYYFGEVRI